MAFGFRPISEMRHDAAYHMARHKGLLGDPRQHVKAKLQQLGQEYNRVATEVDKFAREGIAELSSLGAEVETCVRSSVAKTQAAHHVESVEDLQAINSNGQKTLAKANQHLHNVVEKTKALKENIENSKKVLEKQLEGGPLSSFVQGAGNQAIHCIATRKEDGPST